MSENVVNLSNLKLSKAEVSFLSRSLKFCPTPNSVDKLVLREDLETFGRTLRRIFEPYPFRSKSKLNYILVILKRNFFLRLKLNVLITV